MKNNNILYTALVAASLTISPILTSSLSATVRQNKQNNLSLNIAKKLYNRGIDNDAAHKITNEFFAGNEDLFAVLLGNLEYRCSALNKDEIMNYISSLALKRESINLDSYASLVNMLHRIKHQAPNKKVLKELKDVASINSAYMQMHQSIS